MAGALNLGVLGLGGGLGLGLAGAGAGAAVWVSAGLCWARGSGLALELGWRRAGGLGGWGFWWLGAGLGSSGKETEIGKLKMERLCPVLWGWAGHDLEVVSRPEKRFPCFEFGGPGLGWWDSLRVAGAGGLGAAGG